MVRESRARTASTLVTAKARVSASTSGQAGKASPPPPGADAGGAAITTGGGGSPRPCAPSDTSYVHGPALGKTTRAWYTPGVPGSALAGNVTVFCAFLIVTLGAIAASMSGSALTLRVAFQGWPACRPPPPPPPPPPAPAFPPPSSPGNALSSTFASFANAVVAVRPTAETTSTRAKIA